MTQALHDLTIDELHKKLVAKEVSAVQLTEAFLKRIEEQDTTLKTYITRTPQEALAMAKEADARLKKNDRVTPLTGIPIGLKDIFLTKGIKTTCASKILENFIPPYDATVVSRLRDAGAVFLGKLNMDEFAMGSSTENSYFGASRNPWNPAHIPGGSSGGTAAAVAGGLSCGSLGTDTGGSIRQPSSHCNLVGLKPTYGRVSRYGVIAFASSLDQVGPMARSITDAAHLLQVIAGHDPHDSTSAPMKLPTYTSALKGPEGAKKMVLGIPKQYIKKNGGGISPDVMGAFEKAVKKFEELGAEIREVNLPHLDYSVAIYYIIAPAEASSNLARYDGIRYGYRTEKPENLSKLYQRSRAEGFGAEVKRRVMLGTYVLSAGYYDAYYLKAQKIRGLIRADFDQAFTTCDALISPVAPTPAFKIGEKATDPLEMYLSDIFTIAVNLAGISGMSVPCGFSSTGLPIGMQIMGKPFQEEVVLRLGHAYEQSCDWWTKRPKS